ncbi:ABC transporter substrate-binding protein [Phyllobacterium salinisoli]|uniref:ABC transporter substrate-binding protein n=1 Tax=Phyllobacterium salinisoli TaxID=1899321 RepID=A0A368JZX5_9HYPH|nr:ABC transporter substrate-binding protein [Phyllobacterium salinisoli]RCS22677.1 ABC transporter substrate-binding protein [Phyllobacterium salinisoli]
MKNIWIRFCALLAAFLAAGTANALEGSRHLYPAPQTERDVLSIHAATDVAAMEPLILDFQKMSPDTAVEYVEYVTNDLYNDAEKACRNGAALGDIYLSSSVDQLVKLANDGCAISHRSPQIESVASWANWRDEVFGFTFEPSVFVYNSNFVPAADVARTHVELADLLRHKLDFYRGRIGTYDLRQSGIGYLLAFYDAKQTTTVYGRLLESMSRADAAVRCCNSEVLQQVASGNFYIGYNILGSYAYAEQKRNPQLKIVLPRDYTLILSRGALIPKNTARGYLGARFLDYLLSPRGQAVAREKAFFFSEKGPLPLDVDGPLTLVESGIARPIRIGPELLAAQDQAQRERFIADWSNLIIHGGNAMR